MSPVKTVVQKYGGSSVSDIEALKRVAMRIVQTVRSGWRVVVVVSAMGNTTNELISLAKSVSKSPKRRELDLLVSVGERVSMTLLAMAIQDLGVPAKSFTGSQSGIITDENHVSAQIVEVRPHRIETALQEGNVAIVAGFQGVSRQKEVTTLGRGGSDTTAVALAAALKAEFCEICSDVDGVYTADPKVAHTARLIEKLPLDGAIAMTRNGAKVLHSAAMDFAKRKGICLRATASVNSTGTGTLISPGAVPATPIAVAADDKLIWISVQELHHLEELKGAIRYVWREDDAHELLIDTRNLHDLAQAIPKTAQNRGFVAAVSLIGGCEDPIIISKAEHCLKTLNPQKIWCVLQTFTAIVAVEDVSEAQRLLHAAIVEPHFVASFSTS